MHKLIIGASLLILCASDLNANHHHSICTNIEESLSHLTDEKAKSIITGFCSNLEGEVGALYIDKAQVTINVQGDDANYKEKHHYKNNYGEVNKYQDGYWDD